MSSPTPFTCCQPNFIMKEPLLCPRNNCICDYRCMITLIWHMKTQFNLYIYQIPLLYLFIVSLYSISLFYPFIMALFFSFLLISLNSILTIITATTAAMMSATGPAKRIPSIPEKRGKIRISGIRKIICLVKDMNIPRNGLPTEAKN